MADPIKPNHYKLPKLDTTCVDVIEELCEMSTNNTFTDYNRFQSFKYVWRAGNKDDVLQDLKKARQFLDFAIYYEEKIRGYK